MNKSVSWLTLDLNRRDVQGSVSFGQGETGRRICIRLTENGKPYEISRGCYAVMSGTLPDGSTFFNDCSIIDGVIVYDVTAKNASQVGVAECEVQIYGYDGGLLRSPRLHMVIHKGIFNVEDVEGSQEFNALSVWLAEAKEAISNAGGLPSGDSSAWPVPVINTAKTLVGGPGYYTVSAVTNTPSDNAPLSIIEAKNFTMSTANGMFSDLVEDKMGTYSVYTATGADPCFFYFKDSAGRPYARYAVVKYRTAKQGIGMQIYMGSNKIGPTNDDEMIEIPIIGDSQWHLAIFDLKILEDRGKLNGFATGYVRLDVMEPLDGGPGVQGASIAVQYFAFFDSKEKAEGYEQDSGYTAAYSSFGTFYWDPSYSATSGFSIGGADTHLLRIDANGRMKLESPLVKAGDAGGAFAERKDLTNSATFYTAKIK